MRDADADMRWRYRRRLGSAGATIALGPAGAVYRRATRARHMGWAEGRGAGRRVEGAEAGWWRRHGRDGQYLRRNKMVFCDQTCERKSARDSAADVPQRTYRRACVSLPERKQTRNGRKQLTPAGFPTAQSATRPTCPRHHARFIDSAARHDRLTPSKKPWERTEETTTSAPSWPCTTRLRSLIRSFRRRWAVICAGRVRVVCRSDDSNAAECRVRRRVRRVVREW